MLMRPLIAFVLSCACACAPRSVDRSVDIDAQVAVDRPDVAAGAGGGNTAGGGGAVGAGGMGGTAGVPAPDAAGGGGGGGPVDAPPSEPPPDASVSPTDATPEPVDARPVDVAPADVPPEAAPMRLALLVLGSPNGLTAGDRAIQAALESRNFMVMVVGDAAATAANATGKDLVVLAGSSASEVLARKFRTVTVPVLNLEAGVMDDMGMTGTNAANFGEQGGTAIAVVGQHPLGAGLSGMVTVASMGASLNFGVPGMGAETAATVPGMSNRAVIFGYPAGAQMVGLSAPAVRVGFFAGESAAQRLNDNGRALLRAAIDWAVR